MPVRLTGTGAEITGARVGPENWTGVNSASCDAAKGHRHGHGSRSLLGTFGRVEIAVPRARLDTAEGKTTEWKSTALRAYQRRTKRADSLIAGAYLAGTNTRRVRRALAAVFGGAQQRYREPGVAKGESRLGCLEFPLARRGTDRPPDP